jgi:hypothetical protein
VRGASAGLGQLSFDGVPLFGELTGAFNLSTVPVDALERVEIVRGANGPRYGSRPSGASSGSKAAMPEKTGASCTSKGVAITPCRRRSAGPLRGCESIGDRQ